MFHGWGSPIAAEQLPLPYGTSTADWEQTTSLRESLVPIQEQTSLIQTSKHAVQDHSQKKCTTITSKNLSTSTQFHSNLRRLQVHCRLHIDHDHEWLVDLYANRGLALTTITGQPNVDIYSSSILFTASTNNLSTLLQFISKLLRSQVNLSTSIYSNLFAFATSMSNVSTGMHSHSRLLQSRVQGASKKNVPPATENTRSAAKS